MIKSMKKLRLKFLKACTIRLRHGKKDHGAELWRRQPLSFFSEQIDRRHDRLKLYLREMEQYPDGDVCPYLEKEFTDIANFAMMGFGKVFNHAERKKKKHLRYYKESKRIRKTRGK